MPHEHEYFVYILASRSRTLYVGVTNNQILRILQHRQGKADTFTARYKITRLVYFSASDTSTGRLHARST
ncbi:GIY-YIG nuclease family protein [Granulicella aggregans]|uniref:GIY-YIG nuclease family protein n=1 Tax=Granulicella aggregans TaxID=474949 RepID=UPI0037BEB442